MSAPTNDFRAHLFDPSDERISSLVGLDAYAYREVAKADDFTGGLIRNWRRLYPAEFRGVTNDGRVIDGLFVADPARPGEEAPTERMVAAAAAALSSLTDDQRARLTYPVDAVEWQSWANPEFLNHDTGLRLENIAAASRNALLEVVRASMSDEGWSSARTLMRINGFLGDVVGLPGIMNEYSYNMALYGTPSTTEPWGWQLFGHHVAMNCLVLGGRMVFTPVFFAAEPDHLEVGDVVEPSVFAARVAHGRALLHALDPEQRRTATTYAAMVDPAMPPGRVDPGDERHLGGAFQDNRVVPYEGIRVAELSPAAVGAVRRIVADFTDYLPDGPAAARRREIESHFDDTWFSWIGGSGPADVFYFRLQSPVVMLELDHHCGVFLNNRQPAPFHIHTVMRTPNGNDYGRSLVRAHRRER